MLVAENAHQHRRFSITLAIMPVVDGRKVSLPSLHCQHLLNISLALFRSQ